MTASKLATFKCDPDSWQQFKTKAEAAETSASALLKSFMAAYLDGSLNLDEATPIAAGLDDTINAKLDPLLAELADLRGKSQA